MYKDFKTHLENEIKNTKNSGLFKKERIITSPQNSIINTNPSNLPIILWRYPPRKEQN